MSNKPQMRTYSGLASARGIVSGPVFVYRGDGDFPIPEYKISPGQVATELLRIQRARDDARRDIEGLISVLKERTGKNDVMIFESHLMMLEDPMLVNDTNSNISEHLLNAEAAVRKTYEKTRSQFERMNDDYFRERLRDIYDVERRLQKSLNGFSRTLAETLRNPAIIVADDLTPSETIQLPREYVLGFATNKGSTTSHAALLARAMGIPAVSGLVDITEKVTAGEMVILDGTAGAITLNPDDAALASLNVITERSQSAISKEYVGSAGVLADGSQIKLYANVHPGVALDGIKELGASGVGLYRSEYLWLNGGIEPSEEEQFRAYKEAAEFAKTLGPEAVMTIRTLDIGGDKTVKGIVSKEDNPFLGNRSIRYSLSHRDSMIKQLRAILRASAYGKLAMMYPMISCVDELKEAAKVLAEIRNELDQKGIAYDHNLPIGAMIEIPSAALNARALAKYVDFFSIGTNDLVQYTMAADRTNDAVAYLYQPTNPAVITLIRNTIAAAKEAKIEVAVCGESAADPVLGVLWVAMGVDVLSMSATYIPTIAKVLRQLRRDDLAEYVKLVDELSGEATAQEIMTACRKWMTAKVPGLDELAV